MPNSPDSPISLPEQIYSEFFARLEADRTNDARLVSALRSCLSNGAIGDRKRIQVLVADAMSKEPSA